MQIKTKIVSCPTADSKPVRQEVNGTLILPPLVFPALTPERFGRDEDGGSEDERDGGLDVVEPSDAVQTVPDAFPHVDVAKAPHL